MPCSHQPKYQRLQLLRNQPPYLWLRRDPRHEPGTRPRSDIRHLKHLGGIEVVAHCPEAHGYRGLGKADRYGIGRNRCHSSHVARHRPVHGRRGFKHPRLPERLDPTDMRKALEEVALSRHVLDDVLLQALNIFTGWMLNCEQPVQFIDEDEEPVLKLAEYGIHYA